MLSVVAESAGIEHPESLFLFVQHGERAFCFKEGLRRWVMGERAALPHGPLSGEVGGSAKGQFRWRGSVKDVTEIQRDLQCKQASR